MKKVELPVINNQQGDVITSNCFRFYAFSETVDGKDNRVQEENRGAALYFLEGLKALHQGYFEGSRCDPVLHPGYVRRAFAYFHQALATKPNYFCAREALRHTAGLLGQSDIAENEEYALQMSDNPHPEKSCHLMHPGFYSASDLSKLEESLSKK